MADSFFGFDSEMPALGAGKKMENDLGTSPEEEIDMMNDETFGDGALLGDDWEEQHEKMAGQLHKYATGHMAYHHGCSDHMAGHMTYRNGADSRGESPENELEHSINQLVVDDEEDVSVAASTGGRPIPGRGLPVDLENLFGPSSPPGLFDAENLVAGQQNIWGSPTAQDSFVKRQDEGLKMLLKQMQAGSTGLPQVHENHGQTMFNDKMISHSLPEAYTLEEIEGSMARGRNQGHNAFTVEELEKQLTRSHHPLVGHGSLGGMMRNRIPSPVLGELPLPIGTPPQGTFMKQAKNQAYVVPQTVPVRISPTQAIQGRRQQLLKILATSLSNPSPSPRPVRVVSPSAPSSSPQSTELRMVQALIGESPPPTVKLTSMARNILQGMLDKQGSGDRGSPGMGKPMEADGTSPHVKPLMPTITTPPQQRIPSHSSSTDPLHTRGRGNYHQGAHRGGHPKQSLFHQERDFRDRTRHDSNGGYHGRGNRGFYQNGDRGGYRQDGDWERGGYRHRGDREWGGHGYDRGDYRRSPGQHHHYNNKSRHTVGPYGDSDAEDEELHNRDEYAGLMSKREKDWIIKIQLMQLQTDNPYLDDFYFTLWQLKKLAKERYEREVVAAAKDGGEPALVLPQLSGRVEFKPYKPVQFENSLGKLTAASVHNPRQIIDVRRDQAHKDDIKGRELRRFRQLLLDIEQAYDLLLVIDDLEKRAMALPEDARPAVLDNRRQAIHSMYLGMRADCEETDFFRRVINVRKGIKLIARLLPILEQSEAVKMTIALLQNLGDVVNKKGWQKAVLPAVYDAIVYLTSLSDLETLVKFAATFQSSGATFSLSNSLQNQFGSSVIWCFVKRGETIYQKVSPLDLDVKDQKSWVEFVELVAENLSNIDEKDLPRIPRYSAKSVQEHFKRQLHRSLYLSIDDTLQQITTPKEPSDS